MPYGLRIIPDDGGKPVQIDTSSRMLSYLGRYRVNGAQGQSGNTVVNVPITPMSPGGTPIVIPNMTVAVRPNGTSLIPYLFALRSLSVSGGNMQVGFYQETGASNVTIADVNVFEIAAAQQGDFGIAFYDSVNFLAITDSSRFGYVVYRATINVNGSYQLPSSIPNIDNCVVFAHWDNPDYSLWYDRDTRQIQAYGSFSSAGGSAANGVINNVQICIVGTGFSPPKPDSGYGLIIRNAQGVITFSSKYMPVIWKGGYFDFPAYMENDTGRPAKERYISASAGVSRPMIPLCSLGFMAGDFKTTGEYGLRQVLYSGFKMVNNQVTTYMAKAAGQQIASDYTYVRAQVAYRLPCLDGVDYI